jgi:CHAT domain
MSLPPRPSRSARELLFGGGIPDAATPDPAPSDPDPTLRVPTAETVPDPAMALGAAPANGLAELPPGTAQLVVLPFHGDGRREAFRILGTCCSDLESYYQRRNEDPVHDRPAALPLGRRVSRDVGQGGELPTRTLRRMLGWSHRKPHLTEWLSDLRRRHGTELTLIIWDHTDYDMPWEMFHLERQAAGRTGPALDAAWLGCAATVARWTKVVTTAENEVPGPTVPAACKGSVLCYVAKDKEMQPDRELMDTLGAAHRDSLVDLLTTLEDPASTDGLGLVYIAGHGDYTQDYFDFRLDHSVGVGDIDGRGLAGLAVSRPLVFLNACHSARMIDVSKDLGEDTLAGFTEVFLRAGAAAFIGASGAVQEPAAQAVVRALLQRIRDTPGQPIARILREYRQSVAPTDGNLPIGDDKATSRELLRFLYTFMYLYFGSPLTTLHLHDGSGSS